LPRQTIGYEMPSSPSVYPWDPNSLIWALGRLVTRNFDMSRRVRVDQPFTDGEVERGPQRAAQVLHGGGGLREALPVRDLGDLGEDRSQQRPVEVGQPVLAKVRDQGQLQAPGVVQPRSRPNPQTRVQPMPQPPFHRPPLGGAVSGSGIEAGIPRLPSGDL
jgi:hypothetical protein